MPGAQFGAAAFFLGTGLTSFMALLLATPLAFFLAAAASFTLPFPVNNALAAVVETMAGIPSVVFGLFGFTVLGPIIVHRVGPWLNHWLSPIPFISGPVVSETNLFVATVVLTLMLLPIIAVTTRAAMEQVPWEMVASARALGWTESEVFWRVVWPYSRHALLGGMILGLGRAFGETMAVLMVSGNALNVLPADIYSGVSTMAATIAGQLDSALTDPTHMAVHALGTLGLVLMAITVAVNLIARLWIVPRAGAGRRRGGMADDPA
jgi:phosphate transport system permease protein